MKYYPFSLLIITGFFVSLATNAQEFLSGTKAATIVELYTSEGCSSCPRADQFISKFADQDDPFLNFIPLAYHVDYWNYIGWEDRFSRPEYSQRQRTQEREGNISQVYTPGFVVNNKEWRSWFRGDTNIPQNKGDAGVLSATLIKGLLDVNYTGHPETEGPYVLNVAYLGMGLSTQIKAGENKNKTLHHDYVVLENFSQISQSKNWTVKLNTPPEKQQERTALAIWVSTPNSIKVLQADAALLQEDAF